MSTVKNKRRVAAHKLLTIALGLLMVVSAWAGLKGFTRTADAADVNLIADGGFENQTFAQFDTSSAINATKFDIVDTADDVHSGSYAAKGTMTLNGKLTWAFYNRALSPDRDYQFSTYIRVNEAGANGFMASRLELSFITSAGTLRYTVGNWFFVHSYDAANHNTVDGFKKTGLNFKFYDGVDGFMLDYTPNVPSYPASAAIAQSTEAGLLNAADVSTADVLHVVISFATQYYSNSLSIDSTTLYDVTRTPSVPAKDMTGNLFRDGSFESATVGPVVGQGGFYIKSLNGTTESQTAITDERARSGDLSFKISNFDAGPVNLSLEYNAVQGLKKDTKYKLTWNLMTSEAGESNYIYFNPRIVLLTTGGSIEYVFKRQVESGYNGFFVKVNNRDWKEFSIVFSYGTENIVDDKAIGITVHDVTGFDAATVIYDAYNEPNKVPTDNVTQCNFKMYMTARETLLPTGSLYFDDITLFEEYSAQIYLSDDGAPASGATFTYTDYYGADMGSALESSYVNGVYTFDGLYGPTYFVPTFGGSTSDEIVVNARVPLAFNTPLENVLTFVDQFGDSVEGLSYVVESGDATIEEATPGAYTVSDLEADALITFYKPGYQTLTINAIGDILTYTGSRVVDIYKVVEISDEYNGIKDGNFEKLDKFSDTFLSANIWYSYSLEHALGSNIPSDAVKTTVELTDEEVMAGDSALKVTYGTLGESNGNTPLFLGYRVTAQSLGLNRKAYINGYVKAKDNDIDLTLYMAGTKNLKGVNYKYMLLPSLQVSSEYWTNLNFWVEFTFDETKSELYLTTSYGSVFTWSDYDGTEDWLGGLDLLCLRGTKNDVIYLDSFSLTHEFDATVGIRNADLSKGTAQDFVVTDLFGYTVDVEAVDADGDYKFAGLKGPVTITYNYGDKQGTSNVLWKWEPTHINEMSYTSVITLRDKDGNAITDATIIAKKGSIIVGAYVEGENGVYTIENLTGTVTLSISHADFEFDAVTVSADSHTKEVVTTTEAAPVDSGNGNGNGNGDAEEQGCGSCKGGIDTAVIMMVLLAMSAIIIMTKKRKED